MQDELVLAGCSKASLFLLLAFLLSGCQINYYLHTGYQQSKLLWNRVPVEEALKNPKLTEKQKAKLLLAQEAKNFAENELGLKSNGNYESFVFLDRDAVTYVVQVAYANELKSYEWKFPIVGAVPYKGYFKKELAEKEAARFPKSEYDTWIRGVRAYSTLGWFRDPITSPMLLYREHDLVETIIHELTHATIYVKNHAEFNERLATFVGVEGAKLFYQKKEGSDSKTKRLIENEQHDLELFSPFISEELGSLRQWYKETPSDAIIQLKEDRIKDIQRRFDSQVKPRLRTDMFGEFSKRELNNAILMSFQTYVSDLSAFEDLYKKLDEDLPRFIQEILKLKKSKRPDLDLKSLSTSL